MPHFKADIVEVVQKYLEGEGKTRRVLRAFLTVRKKRFLTSLILGLIVLFYQMEIFF